MKKLNIIEGIKSSLPDLINRSQDIFFNNYGELVGRVFTPGFFVKRKTDGTFEDDFKPSVTTESSANIIQVSITGRNPAYCYVAGGKILTLNDIIKIDPREIDGYYNYNTVGSVNSVNITYELWVVPQEVEQDPVDYLPQYQDNKQSKNLTVNYLVGFLLIKKGSTPPIIINPSVQERTSNTPVTTTRNIPSTVEGLKLAEFTYNESTTTITNLQDLRGSSRAYLQPTLYDFFDSLFLKHDFILAHAEDSAGANSLVFAKNGTGNPKLTGRFLLVGAKEKVTTFLSKITVTASAVEIPINSIIYINLTDVEYYSQTNITKTLQVQSINDFTPNRDKLVLGYHLRTYLDGGNNPEEIESGLDVIDTTGTSTVNDEQSVIYFVNGLPPLPPGQSISREGIPSYVLTKDEAVSAYYNKTQSNNRFIKSGNDDLTLNEELFRTQTFMTYDSTKDSSEKYSGIKILDSTVPFNKRLGWVIRNSAGVPIGSLSRVSVDANTNYLELILSNDNGANLKAIRINQNGNVTVEGANPFPGDSSGDQNKFITVAHGVLNSGDDLRGVFNLGVGRMKFYQPNSSYNPALDDSAPSDSIPNTDLAFEIIYDAISDVVMDMHTHIITGLKVPRIGTDGLTDATNRAYVDNADSYKYDKTGGTINGNVNVTGNVSVGGNETINGTLGVTGDTTLNNTTIQGTTVIACGSLKYNLVSLLKELKTKQLFLN